MKKKEIKKGLTPVLSKVKRAGNRKQDAVKLKTEDKSQKTEEGSRNTEVERVKKLISNKLLDVCKRLPHPIESFGGANAIRENSTVFLTIKPFIKGTFLFAEGRFSESQPVRSWMMIRIYNN